jgi:hypothetical protein
VGISLGPDMRGVPGAIIIDCGVMGIRLLFLMVLIVGSGCDVIVVLSAGVC